MARRLAVAEAEVDGLRLSVEWDSAYRTVRTFKNTFGLLQQVTGSHPTASDVEAYRLHVQAEAHFTRGREDECRRYVVRALNVSPSYVDSLILLARLNVHSQTWPAGRQEARTKTLAPLLAAVSLPSTTPAGAAVAATSLPVSDKDSFALLQLALSRLNDGAEQLSPYRVHARLAGCGLMVDICNRFPTQVHTAALEWLKEGHEVLWGAGQAAVQACMALQSGQTSPERVASAVAAAACDAAWTLVKAVAKVPPCEPTPLPSGPGRIPLHLLADMRLVGLAPRADVDTQVLGPLFAALGLGAATAARLQRGMTPSMRRDASGSVSGIVPLQATPSAASVASDRPGSVASAPSQAGRQASTPADAFVTTMHPRVAYELSSVLCSLPDALRLAGDVQSALQACCLLVPANGTNLAAALTTAQQVAVARAAIRAIVPLACQSVRGHVQDVDGELLVRAGVGAVSALPADRQAWRALAVAMLALFASQAAEQASSYPYSSTSVILSSRVSGLLTCLEHALDPSMLEDKGHGKDKDIEKDRQKDGAKGDEEEGNMTDEELLRYGGACVLRAGGPPQVALALLSRAAALHRTRTPSAASPRGHLDTCLLLASAHIGLADVHGRGSLTGIASCGPVVGPPACSATGVGPGSHHKNCLAAARAVLEDGLTAVVPHAMLSSPASHAARPTLLPIGSEDVSVGGSEPGDGQATAEGLQSPGINTDREAGHSRLVQLLTSFTSPGGPGQPSDWPVLYNSAVLSLLAGRVHDGSTLATMAIRMVVALDSQAGASVSKGCTWLPFYLGSLVAYCTHGPGTAASVLMPAMTAHPDVPLLRLLEARLAEVVSFPGDALQREEPGALASVRTVDGLTLLEMYQRAADLADAQARQAMGQGQELGTTEGTITFDVGLPGGAALGVNDASCPAPWPLRVALASYGHVARVAAAHGLLSVAHAAVTAADGLVDAYCEGCQEPRDDGSGPAGVDALPSPCHSSSSGSADVRLRADVLAMVAMLHEAAGNDAAAQAQYAAALALSPAHAPSLCRLASCAHRQAVQLVSGGKAVDEGTARLEPIAVTAQRHGVAPAVLADATAILLRAESYCARAVRAAPTSAEAWHVRARVTAALGHEAEATSAGLQAMQLAATDALLPATLAPLLL